ncbi:slit homolog 2 protein-like [Strongylocentrotus purpuratus]|uniref:TIR domain-containing protein n=1 Tax=Strongylocentrotus purpuratus TaxID=7668 RepID=A0A7M7PRU1_STRPU|nr:slit homolog 2 protein-like [Strongylocentrotus purpuratus]
MGLIDVPQDLFPGVEELDLSLNPIEYLYNVSFIPYQNIRKLSLYYNDLKEIAPAAFHSMPELQYLNLGANKFLDAITSEMFRLCKKLSHLSFTGTSLLRMFPSDTLRWLPSLQMLDLSYTGLRYINITSCNSAIHNLTIDLRGNKFEALIPTTFNIDCQLDFLNLNRCRAFIFLLDPDTIAAIRTRSLSLGHNNLAPEIWQLFFTGIGSSEIEELRLRNTNVEDVYPEYFALLGGKRLRVLDLSNNDLSDLAQMGFLTLPFISTLVLDRCEITHIDPTYFSRMKGLRVLRLNFNNIYKIGQDDSNSAWDIDLQELYLVSNSIEIIHETAFKGLTNLTKLVLRGNKDLSDVWISAVTGLNNLRYLDLSGCLLTTIMLHAPNLETFVYSNCKRLDYMSQIGEVFSQTKSIKHVFLGNSSITSFWTPYTSNNISLFQGMRNLISLDVKMNQIDLLQAGLFVDLVYLIQIDLSNCQIKVIEANAFEGLQRLHTLFVQGNRFQYLPPEVLKNVGQLQNINLEDNQIRYLDRDLFVNKSKLKYLTLADNRLTLVNQSTFQPILNTLSFIDISNNELGCTCELKWLPIWLAGPITVMNENYTRCSSSSFEKLREKPLMSFKPGELCGPNIALYCSLPIVTTWIIIVLVFAYRHRWFLKYKLFLLKMAVIGYREIRDARDFDDYEFHVNIMFAEEDEEWVRDRFRPVLEELLPEYERKLYGDDDLPLGMHYYDAVHYVVEKSYKTIVLVSRAAIQDNWFIIKFRTAADQVNDTQIENMVVIFLEDIPDDELPFLVRLYLSDRKPYLSWEEEEGFHEYFWQKLTKMLKINLRCNNVIPPE